MYVHKILLDAEDLLSCAVQSKAAVESMGQVS